MIKLSELQPGDIVMAEYEGQQWEGIVKELNREDKEVCVETSVQEFWFTPDHLYPIPLSDGRRRRRWSPRPATARTPSPPKPSP